MPTPAPDQPGPPPAHDDTGEFAGPPAPELSGTGEYVPPPPVTQSGRVPVPVLGDFRLLEALGAGGMGTVYRAEQVSRGRVVALKVLSKAVAMRPGFLERFRREVRAMGRLDHPNIVRYLAAGENNGFVYLAMELIDGGSLGAWVKRLGRLTTADAVAVAAGCARALQYAHEQGLIHRDVKPDNVLLTADGRVKLADLGLAKAAGESDMSLTRTGTGLGTPLYAAPEQARDARTADARSDLYALGGVLYHCLTGRPPFPADSLLAAVQAKEKGVFTPASRHNPAVPAAVDRVLARLLAKRPEHRYQSCGELLEELGWLGLGGGGLSFLPAEG